MSIRTPKEYRHDPNLRAAFRAGVRGYTGKTYFGADLDQLYAMWPEEFRDRYRQERQALQAAFEAGREARRRALEGWGEAKDNLEAAAAPGFPGAALLKREGEGRDSGDEGSGSEVAREHLRRIAETLGIQREQQSLDPEASPQAVTVVREGNRLTVTAGSQRWVYRFHDPYAAERVKGIVLAKAAGEPDWMRWWFELFVEQAGGRVVERTDVAAGTPVREGGPSVSGVDRGGGNDQPRNGTKPTNARGEVNGMAKLQVKNMHFFDEWSDRGNLRATCSLQVGDWVINGVRVMDGKNGLFVSLPGWKGADDKYHDIAHPITKEGREKLNDLVLDHYRQGMSQQKEQTQAQEQVAER